MLEVSILCTNQKNREASENELVPDARTNKVIFSSSVSKNKEVYAPETSCMKATSIHIKNICK